MAYMRLGDLLTSVGLITAEQLQHALEVQKNTHKRLGAVLIDEKIITEQQLIDTLVMQLGIDFIDLGKVQIPWRWPTSSRRRSRSGTMWCRFGW